MMNETRHKKILLIKTGYSETFLRKEKCAPSLGDIFRTTVVLHILKQDEVTWLTDEAAIPLLQGNPHIARVLPYNEASRAALLQESFDKIINLEKVPEICAFSDRINAWSHFGFRLNTATGEVDAYDESYYAVAIATREDLKRLNSKPWAVLLYSMLGAVWQGESYTMGYEPTTEERFDIGFNTHVGKDLPVKAWPMAHWKKLEQSLQDTYTISRQQHLHNLHGYMDWINQCRVLITNDSLGLYLGIAMGKQVVGLFGPTSATEQSPHEDLHILAPPLNRDCMPCSQPTCSFGDPCIAHIAPDSVEATVRALI